MSRVINTNSPNKIRNYNRRTIAEILQRLGKKTAVDQETKDMTACIVYCLRELYATAETTAIAWEKRDYWIKAERFLREWEWTREMAANIEDVIREDAWDLLPQLMMDLFPYFSDIGVKSLTRKPITWHNAQSKLLAEPPQTQLY